MQSTMHGVPHEWLEGEHKFCILRVSIKWQREQTTKAAVTSRDLHRSPEAGPGKSDSSGA